MDTSFLLHPRAAALGGEWGMGALWLGRVWCLFFCGTLSIYSTELTSTSCTYQGLSRGPWVVGEFRECICSVELLNNLMCASLLLLETQRGPRHSLFFRKAVSPVSHTAVEPLEENTRTFPKPNLRACVNLLHEPRWDPATALEERSVFPRPALSLVTHPLSLLWDIVSVSFSPFSIGLFSLFTRPFLSSYML